MKYCPKCRETKPVTDFKKKKNPRYESDIYFAYCNPCATAYKMQHREDNIDEYRIYQKGKSAEYLKQRRRVAIEKYGGRCNCCGETTYEFLCFDHVNNDGAAHRKEVAAAQMLHWLKKNDYPDTIQLLCYNCNMAKGFHGGCPLGHKNTGASEERQRIVGLIEGMRPKVKLERNFDPDLENRRTGMIDGYNQALDDLLQKIEEEKKPFKDLADFVNAPEEKQRKVMLEVAREATNDQRAQIGLPPLHKQTEKTNGACVIGDHKKCPFRVKEVACKCFCHKSRTHDPRTEETHYDKLDKLADASYENFAQNMDEAGIGMLEETEKEGASSSERAEDWEARLQFEVMEKYLVEARLTDAALDPVAHMERMRGHFEKLKSFIREIAQKENTTPQSKELGGEKYQPHKMGDHSDDFEDKRPCECDRKTNQ